MSIYVLFFSFPLQRLWLSRFFTSPPEKDIIHIRRNYFPRKISIQMKLSFTEVLVMSSWLYDVLIGTIRNKEMKNAEKGCRSFLNSVLNSKLENESFLFLMHSPVQKLFFSTNSIAVGYYFLYEKSSISSYENIGFRFKILSFPFASFFLQEKSEKQKRKRKIEKVKIDLFSVLGIFLEIIHR